MNGFLQRHRVSRMIAGFLVAIMMFGIIPSSAAPIETFATTVSDEQDKLDELESQEDELESEQDELQAQIDEQLAVQSEYLSAMLEVQEVIDAFQVDIDDKNAEIDDMTLQIEDKQAEIDEKQEEIDQKQLELEEANETFKNRLAAMYLLSGDLTAINVLFGAESFSAFLTQSQALQSISENDQALMEELQRIQQELIDLQTEMQAQKIELENSKMELEMQMEELVALQAEQQVEYDSYESMKAEVDALISSISALYSSNEALLDELAEDKAEVQAEIDRLIEESLAQQEEESGSSESAGSDSSSVPSSSGWIQPLAYYTYISTYFNVVDAWHSSAHMGVDFASPAGTAIYASRSGTVIISKYSSSYGNYVMIDHGDGFYSLYAHASALYVSVGDYVSQGQNIAAVGTTGNSTGNHLHFEIRYGSTYLDPLDYL